MLPPTDFDYAHPSSHSGRTSICSSNTRDSVREGGELTINTNLRLKRFGTFPPKEHKCGYVTHVEGRELRCPKCGLKYNRDLMLQIAN